MYPEPAKLTTEVERCIRSTFYSPESI